MFCQSIKITNRSFPKGARDPGDSEIGGWKQETAGTNLRQHEEQEAHQSGSASVAADMKILKAQVGVNI